MSEQAKAVSGQPVLDPAKVQEDGHGWEGIPENWRHAVHTYQPCEGMFINCINGRTGSKWAFAAEGPPAFSVNILLEGRMQAALDDGAVLSRISTPSLASCPPPAACSAWLAIC